MLSLTEQQEISEMVDTLEGVFTDEVIDAAEFYDIEEDEISLQTTVTLYGENGEALASAKVEDYEMAMVYMEEVFDLEEYDPENADRDIAAGASRYGH